MKCLVAEVHRKYDVQFREMMEAMTKDLNAALREEPVARLDISTETDILARAAGDRIEGLVLGAARLTFSIAYAGDPR